MIGGVFVFYYVGDVVLWVSKGFFFECVVIYKVNVFRFMLFLFFDCKLREILVWDIVLVLVLVLGGLFFVFDLCLYSVIRRIRILLL